MGTNIYLTCLIAGLLGQLFQMLVKIVQLSKRAKVANIDNFSVKQYLVDDKWPILLNMLGLLIVVYLFDELTRLKPAVMEYVKFFFITVGYMGSSLLSVALSKAEKKINSIVNTKTDIADGKD